MLIMTFSAEVLRSGHCKITWRCVSLVGIIVSVDKPCISPGNPGSSATALAVLNVHLSAVHAHNHDNRAVACRLTSASCAKSRGLSALGGCLATSADVLESQNHQNGDRRKAPCPCSGAHGNENAPAVMRSSKPKKYLSFIVRTSAAFGSANTCTHCTAAHVDVFCCLRGVACDVSHCCARSVLAGS